MKAGSLIRALDGQPGQVRLLPFQRSWIRASFADGIDVGVLSAPRGSGKTMLLGRLAALAVTPGSPIYHAGDEVVCVAGTIEQGKLLARAATDALPDDYLRWTGLLGGGHRVVGVHRESGSTIRVISGSGKAAMGLGARNRLLLGDEPGSWERRDGALMFEALSGALGKLAGSRLLMIGTKSPAHPGDWWPLLLEDGSGPGSHVAILEAAEGEPWDDYQTLARVNPVLRVSTSMRRTVLRERDEARLRSWRQSAFEAWRLNRLRQPEREMLLDVSDWKRVTARPCPPREGQPVVGLDLGSSRSWTGCVALWESGRVEAFAVTAGLPSLSDRERKDGAPRGTYEALHTAGSLILDEGLRVTTPGAAIAEIDRRGWNPKIIVCDFFKLADLRDATKLPLRPRRQRWSEASFDIGALRQLALDGDLSVDPEAVHVLSVSLGATGVERDTSANMRLSRDSSGHRRRDDLAAGLVLAAGEHLRRSRRPERTLRTALVR